MKDKGIVYGFIGAIGSGKSYRLDQLKRANTIKGIKTLDGDFSDGIRETLAFILTGKAAKMDINSDSYSYWKNNGQVITTPTNPLTDTPYASMVTGRQLLQRCGEYIKTLAGPAVWADWTAKRITEEWVKLDEFDAYTADIAFGSVRFAEEVVAILNVGKMMSKDVKFIFCDYKSPRYEINDHVSENFARYFINKGFKDGDNITAELINIVARY